MSEVIDLLSDGEDENVENAAMSDDDEIEFVGVVLPASSRATPSLASSRKPRAKKTPSETTNTPRNPYASCPTPVSATTTQHCTPKVPARIKNPYARTTKSTPRVVSQSSENAYDSDSSLDSIMNGGPTFSVKKKSPAAAHSTASSAAPSAGTSNASACTASAASTSPPVHASLQATSSAAATAARASIPPSMQSTTTANDDPPFQYPALLSNSKQYPDLRPNFILAFWRCARKFVQHSYDRPKLDQMANKIVLLALTPHPIRSLEEYCYGRGVGGGSGATAADRAKRDEVRKQLLEGGLETTKLTTTTPSFETRKYTSIAEACLVAMLHSVERRLCAKDLNPQVLRIMDDTSLQGMLSEQDMWISLQDLIPAIDALLKPECPARLTRARDEDNGAAHYAETTTRSAEFLQIKKLETCHKELGDYQVARIKRHRQRGTLLFELTHLGFKTAVMVQERTFPLPPNYYRTSRIQRMSQVEESYKNICVGVDLREGGGGHSALHEMCNTLDLKKLPFFVASLKIGDYVFFTRGPTGSLDNLCPILVERKSIEDIALSIHDGRWHSQKQRMYVGQYVFGYENSRMVFIIEGKEERQQVSGGYIGHRMYNVDMQRVKDEIENLKSEGFEVLRTPSRKSTMFELSRWANRVAESLESGELHAKYTYAQFNEEVKKIPRDTDFSRLAKYHAGKLREETTAAPAAASKRSHADVDSDSDIEVLEVSSPPTASMKPAARPSSRKKSPLIDRKRSAARSFPRGDIAALRTAPQGRTPVSDRKKPAARASSEKKKSAKKPKTHVDAGIYSDWTAKQLQEACAECGLPKSGKKKELIARLNGPRPPKLWLRRKQSGEYVPERHNVGGTALLVALYLHEKDAGDDDRGMTKDELYTKAEGLSITKNPFSGDTTQTGPYLYDGWINMKYLLKGDPPLVTVKKGTRYKLTRCSELAGFPIAKAMHKWCHDWGNCPCGESDV